MFGKLKEELKKGNVVDKKEVQDIKNVDIKELKSNHRNEIWEGRDNNVPYDKSWEDIQTWAGSDIEGNPDNEEVALEVWLGMKRP